MDGVSAPQMQSIAAPVPSPGMVPHAGGIMRMVSNAQMDAAERTETARVNAQPLIQGLAGYLRKNWEVNRMAKMQTVEERMLQSVRQRRGEYDPAVISEIRKGGGSEVYMMLTSNKCRAAGSWLRDVLLGTNKDKPWTIEPTPLPDLPPEMAQSLANLAMQEAQAFEASTGQQVQPQDMAEFVSRVKDRVVQKARQRAREMSDRMELKMEDQLIEGNFREAFSEFIDDITTFPAAIMHGPIVRKKAKLKWGQDAKSGYQLEVIDTLALEWERIDPFMVYPSPGATKMSQGNLIIRHQLTREALNELDGVEGYNTGAIRAVLDDYGRGGLREWLWIDSAKATAEGRSLSAVFQNSDGLIDALQMWGSVQGKLLIEWGMDPKSIPDPLRDYQCEVWQIGQWTIKAMLNPDPLGRRPYYKASYEEVPGAFWGNSVADLARDTQTQCNTVARAISNNVNISSGPQVSVNTDRLPAGEDVTQIYPWKIWQTTSDPYGSTAKAVDFFMPSSVVGDLINIYTFFSNLADEHTGVPRYMTGDAHVGGAGRTASGMSMLMTNAGKAIKQVVANIDVNVIEPLVGRLYFYNMRYGDDPALKGDVNCRACGVEALIVKEQTQVRVNEFLQMCLQNPIVQEIVGEEAIADLLRAGASGLDMDADSIVPPPEVIRARVFAKQQAAQQQAMMEAQAAAQPGQISFQKNAQGATTGASVMPAGGKALPAPGRPQTTNSFAPMRRAK